MAKRSWISNPSERVSTEKKADILTISNLHVKEPYPVAPPPTTVS